MPASRGNIITTVLLIVVLLVGLVAGVFLVRERQNLQSEAAVPGGVATVSLTPATGSFNVGDDIQMSVFFNTDGEPISGVAVRLRYPFSGTSPELAVTSINVNSSFLSSPDWNCPTVSSTEEGSEVVVDIACSNISAFGFSSSSDTLLAQVTLNVNSVPTTNPTTVVFDPTLSVITRLTTGQDILAIPENQGEYTITGGSQPTATQPPANTGTTTPTGTNAPTATTTVTATPTATSTIAATGTVTDSPTPTPDELPDAGVSLPTIISLGFGILVILLSGILFAL